MNTKTVCSQCGMAIAKQDAITVQLNQTAIGALCINCYNHFELKLEFRNADELTFTIPAQTYAIMNTEG